MPWRKRAQLLAAALGGLALLASAAAIATGAGPVGAGHPLVGSALAALTILAAVAALQIYWVRLDLSGASLRRGRSDLRQVALTFDDGPGPDTPAVLDALEAAGVRATFFILGQAAARRPDVIREISRRGHLVALHGYSHRKLHFASSAVIEAEIRAGCRAIQASGVEPAPYFRAPHGFKSPLLSRVLRRRGMTLVGWSRGVWDTERPGIDAIVSRACVSMRPGEILLFHDGCGTPGIDPRRDETAAALPGIIRQWRDAGYEFVTVESMEIALRTRPGASRPHFDAGHIRSVPGIRPAATALCGPTVPGTTVPGNASHEDETPKGASGRGSRSRHLTAVLRWLGPAVIVVLGALALRHLDIDQLRRSFSEADAALLIAAAVANVLALAMQSGRWLAIVHPIEPRAKARDAFFTLVAGYAIGLLVPARASDLARAHLMARRSGSATATLAATAVIDHVLGSVALFGLVGLLATLSPLPLWVRSAGTLAAALAVAAVVALWVLRPRRPGAGDGAPAKGVKRMVQRIRLGLVAVTRPRALAVASVFAFAGWASEVLIAHLALSAFRLPADVRTSFLLVLATTVSAAASISPGNAGAFELACVVALGGLGIGQEPALAFAIGYHAVHLIPTALIGGGWLLTHGYRMTLLREVG